MPSQDYTIRFIIENLGKQNLDAINASMKQAGVDALAARDAAIKWETAVRQGARDAGVSLGEYVKQLKLSIENQQKAEVAAQKAGEQQQAAARKAQQEQERYNRELQKTAELEEKALRAKLEGMFGGGVGGAGGGGGMGGGASSLFGRIGGRIAGAEVGGALGIPGAGFMGSQIAYGLGISGGAAMGLLGAAGALYGVHELAKATEETMKYAQEQRNLSRELGISSGEMATFSAVSAATGIHIETAARATSELSAELTKGGPRAREISESLKTLGLSDVTAFKGTTAALEEITAALAKIPDPARRSQVAVDLLKESGRDLAAVAQDFPDLSQKLRIDDHTVDNLGRAADHLGAMWQSLKEGFAGAISGVIDAVSPNQGYRPPLAVGPDATSGISAIGGGPIVVGAGPSRRTQGLTISGRGGFQLPSGEGMLESKRLYPGDILNMRSALAGQAIQDADRSGRYAGSGEYPTAAMTPAERKAYGLEQYNKAATTYGTPEDKYHAKLQDIEKDADSLKKDAAAGSLTKVTIEARQRSIESRKMAAAAELKAEQEVMRQQTEFTNLRPVSELTTDEIFTEMRNLPHDFSTMAGSRGYQARKSELEAARDQVVRNPYTFLDTTVPPETKKILEYQKKQDEETQRQAKDLEEDWRRDVMQKTKDEEIKSKTNLAMIHGGDTRAIATAKLQQATQAGFSRFGLSPQEISRREAEANLAAIRSEGLGKQTQLGAEAAEATRYAGALRAIPGVDKEKYDEALNEATKKRTDMEVAGTEALTKSIDVINKFNESIDKASEQVADKLSGDITSILMGAQRGAYKGRGGQGALLALRGVGEGLESQFLTNIIKYELGVGGVTGPHGGLANIGATLSQSPFGAALVKGTILDSAGKKVEVGQGVDTSLHVISIDKGITAIAQAYANQPGGGGGSAGGGPTSYGGFNIPTPFGMLSLPNLGALASYASAGSVGYGTLGNLPGTSSMPLFPGGVGSETGSLYMTTGGAVPSVFGKDVAEVLKAAGAGLAIYQGVRTLATGGGGAQKVAGGAGEVAGGLAGIASLVTALAPAAPFLAAGAAALGFAASLLPDPRTQRANQISKAIFTDTYIAPQAQNVSESGNGGYADVNFQGGVRTSNLSPFPVVSQGYEDVPRRTIVPGHTISQFGGYTGTPGAIVTPTPPAHITIVAMDSESFHQFAQRNGSALANSLHHALNGGQATELVSSLESHLGLR